jgi:hypothetical protein
MKILSDDYELSVSYRYIFKEKGIEVVYRNILPVRPNHEKNYFMCSENYYVLMHKRYLLLIYSNALAPCLSEPTLIIVKMSNA